MKKNSGVKVKLSDMAKREEKWALLFVTAPAVGFLLFMLWPIIFAFLTSLTTWNGAKGFAGMMKRFCGFENYIKLFRDAKFWQTLWTTVIYLIGIPVGKNTSHNVLRSRYLFIGSSFYFVGMGL